MIRALYTASTGLEAQQLNLDTVANNLANVNTTAFKKMRTEFQDLIYQTMKAPGNPGPDGAAQPNQLQVGLGVSPVGTQRLFFQGSLTQTSNPLDLSINGEGFFMVQGGDGQPRYTRDGTLQIDGQGRLSTAQGNLLDPSIQVPNGATNIQISGDGTVTAVLQGQTATTQLGRIETTRFANPAGLKADGGNLYEPTAASGDAISGVPGLDGRGLLQQGYLEGSNVQVVEEMVNMIAAQRAFETNSKVIQSADQMLQMANGLKA